MEWFECRWKKFRPIEYKSDFVIKKDWDIYIIEMKWMETPEFKMKYKMFMRRYWHENELIVAKSIKDLNNKLYQE